MREEIEQFFEGKLVGGWKSTILGENIGARVEAANFEREHWCEGGNIGGRWN